MSFQWLCTFYLLIEKTLLFTGNDNHKKNGKKKKLLIKKTK